MNGITQVVPAVVPATAGQLKQTNRIIADAVEKIVGNIGEVTMETLRTHPLSFPSPQQQRNESQYNHLTAR